MAKRSQLARPMMRRRAGFQPDEARRNPCKESENLASSQLLAHDYSGRLIDRMHLETFFARSRPIAVILPMDGSRYW
jgi:hypothetical protein